MDALFLFDNGIKIEQALKHISETPKACVWKTTEEATFHFVWVDELPSGMQVYKECSEQEAKKAFLDNCP